MFSSVVLRGPWLLTLGLEILIWFGSAIVFLWAYLDLSGAAHPVIWYHFKLLGAVLAILFAIRIALWRWLRIEIIARWLGSILGALLLLFLLSYYYLVIASLNSWGRVVSWPLISTYSAHWKPLAISQGFAPSEVILILGTVLVFTASLIAIGPARRDWAAVIARLNSRSVRLLLIGVPSLGCAYLVAYAASPDGALAAKEPFSLTLFPDQQAGRVIQGHRLVGSEVQDRVAALERDRYQPSPNARLRNVILIVGDALRADHMSIYGYVKQTTPYLNELKSKGYLRLVEHARSVCAESSCGLMALIKSRYVHELASQSMTLLDVLKRHGYETHLILSGDHTNFYGLKEDYGPVDYYFDGFQSGSRYMNDDTLVIDKVATLPRWNGQPTYFQFHLMSSHALGKKPDQLSFLPSESYSPLVIRGVTNAQPKPELINFYDNGVLGFDATVKQLLHLLAEKNYLQDAIVVITGDHGEMLGEDGTFGHTRGLHESVLNIPIIFLEFPPQSNQQAQTLAAIGSQVDVAPSILDMLAMPAPAHWSGRSLIKPAETRILYVQQAPFVGLIDVSLNGITWKYIMNSATGEATAHTVPGNPANNLLDIASPSLRGKWAAQLMHIINDAVHTP